VSDWSLQSYDLNKDYLNEGYLGIWDQELFIDEIKGAYADADLESLHLRKWGLYYYPQNCKDK